MIQNSILIKILIKIDFIFEILNNNILIKKNFSKKFY